MTDWPVGPWGEVRCDSKEETALLIATLQQRQVDLEKRVRHLEKIEDTRDTPWYRRLLFRIDGWPRATRVVVAPAWRPWRKWWTS